MTIVDRLQPRAGGCRWSWPTFRQTPGLPRRRDRARLGTAGRLLAQHWIRSLRAEEGRFRVVDRQDGYPAVAVVDEALGGESLPVIDLDAQEGGI